MGGTSGKGASSNAMETRERGYSRRGIGQKPEEKTRGEKKRDKTLRRGMSSGITGGGLHLFEKEVWKPGQGGGDSAEIRGSLKGNVLTDKYRVKKEKSN